jgi:hypothetical protein
VLASVVAVLGCAAVPAMTVAAPHHNHGLTIAVTPNPIISGEGVLIYGQLNTSNPGGRTIVLYHRINPKPYFTVIGTTKTSTTGFYEFPRAEGVVLSNRSWFVRAPGLPGNIHSRTVHERVAAAVILNPPAPPATLLTNQQVVFTGSVAPDHAGERVLLQEEAGLTGDTWKTLKVGRLDATSQFSIPYRFRIPGDHTVRVLFQGDARNVAAPSDTVTVTVQQKENPHFTITTSAPIIPVSTAARISGVLTMAGQTTPDPNVMVTLWGHTYGTPYAPVTSTTTGTDGTYKFDVTPQHNTVYQVRTSFAPLRVSAQLFEGVQDAVQLSPVPTTSTVGGTVSFTGSVTPDKVGHVIELQRLGADGHYHVVEIGFVNASSAYQFNWTFGTPGMKTFRVHISGGPDNVGADSTPVTINVSLPPVTSLPPAS